VIDTHEYKGFCWLPSDDSQKLAGTLTVKKGEGALDLVGHFGHRLLSETDTEKTYSLGLEEQPRIVGVAASGEKITLEGHRGTSYTEHLPGIPVARYSHHVTLVGKQFAEREAIDFDEIAIRATDVNSWTQISGVQITNLLERNEEHGYEALTGVELRFEVPNNIEITLARGEQAFISFNAPSEGIARGTDHVSLTQEAELHLRFARRTTLGLIFDRVSELRNFLSLAVARPVAILSVTGYRDDHLTERVRTPAPIEILWRIPHNPEPPAGPRHPIEMLFTLPEAKPDISRVMRNWLAKQSRLTPVFNLFPRMPNPHRTSRSRDPISLTFAAALARGTPRPLLRRARGPGYDRLAEAFGHLPEAR
jgi:ApeA N-terminal domain 1